MRRGLILLAVAAVAPLVGCHMRVVAPTVGAPVSASGTLYDPSLKLVRVGDGLEHAQHFELQEQWYWLCGAVPLFSRTHDLSTALRGQIDAVGGDAIVNVQVAVNERPTVLFLFGCLLPVLPTTTSITITGDVVRSVEPDAAASATP